MKLIFKRRNYFILYFNLITSIVRVNKGFSSNISPTRDFEPILKYQSFQEFNSNIHNLGQVHFQKNITNVGFQANRIYGEKDFETRFKGREKGNSNGRDRRSHTNELHKFSKYWLKKLGIPKELPPSAWCNEEGVIVGIPVTNDVIKVLNTRIKSINGGQLPVVTEDFLDNFFDQDQNEQLYSKGMNVACNGKAVISNSFYEINGKFGKHIT